jgi:hypothetical protein
MNTRRPIQIVELTELDLRHVIGGVVAGESVERNHKDDTGGGLPTKPATGGLPEALGLAVKSSRPASASAFSNAFLCGR